MWIAKHTSQLLGHDGNFSMDKVVGVRHFRQFLLKVANLHSFKPRILIGLSNGILLGVDLTILLLDPLMRLLFKKFKPQLSGLGLFR